MSHGRILTRRSVLQCSTGALALMAAGAGQTGRFEGLVSTRPIRPLGPSERAVAEKIADRFRFALAMAAVADPEHPSAAGSPSATAALVLERRSPRRRAIARRHAKQMLAAPLPKRQELFGTFATSPRRIVIDRKLVKRFGLELEEKVEPAVQTLLAGAKYRALTFYLDAIECDTDILLGGFSVAPHGRRKPIKPFVAKPRRIAKFRLDARGPWPRAFVLNLSLGSRAFHRFAQDVWAPIEAGVDAWAPASAKSRLGGFRGEAVSAIVLAVIRDLHAFALGLFETDDPADSVTRVVELKSAQRRKFAGLSGRDPKRSRPNVWAHRRETWNFPEASAKLGLHWRVS